MQSKGIKFMCKEWSISELIENKTLPQPIDYIGYQNNIGQTSILFMNYKPRSLDDTDSVTSDKEPIENRRHSVPEFRENRTWTLR
jgi:hypothetical protein